jgi:hypothetical protein
MILCILKVQGGPFGSFKTMSKPRPIFPRLHALSSLRELHPAIYILSNTCQFRLERTTSLLYYLARRVISLSEEFQLFVLLLLARGQQNLTGVWQYYQVDHSSQLSYKPTTCGARLLEIRMRILRSRHRLVQICAPGSQIAGTGASLRR